MAQNYISRGEVITLTADKKYISGNPYRIANFNGVALCNVEPGELLPLQLGGVFEFSLEGVSVGDSIYIDHEDGIFSAMVLPVVADDDHLFGRAVTATDSNGKFYCRLMQS